MSVRPKSIRSVVMAVAPLFGDDDDDDEGDSGDSALIINPSAPFPTNAESYLQPGNIAGVRKQKVSANDRTNEAQTHSHTHAHAHTQFSTVCGTRLLFIYHASGVAE